MDLLDEIVEPSSKTLMKNANSRSVATDSGNLIRAKPFKNSRFERLEGLEHSYELQVTDVELSNCR